MPQVLQFPAYRMGPGGSGIRRISAIFELIEYEELLAVLPDDPVDLERHLKALSLLAEAESIVRQLLVGLPDGG